MANGFYLMVSAVLFYDWRQWLFALLVKAIIKQKN